MTTPKAAGYIITTSPFTPIYGIGDTPRAALEDSRQWAVDLDSPVVLPASAALINYVREHGGAYLAWGETEDRVQCLPSRGQFPEEKRRKFSATPLTEGIVTVTSSHRPDEITLLRSLVNAFLD